MAYPFAKTEKLIQATLVSLISKTFETLPDNRKGNGVYQKYALLDTALSAFSVFFYASTLWNVAAILDYFLRVTLSVYMKI